MRQNRGLLRGEMLCFPPLTSTDYTARTKKPTHKNSHFQVRAVYTQSHLGLMLLNAKDGIVNQDLRFISALEGTGVGLPLSYKKYLVSYFREPFHLVGVTLILYFNLNST